STVISILRAVGRVLQLNGMWVEENRWYLTVTQWPSSSSGAWRIDVRKGHRISRLRLRVLAAVKDVNVSSGLRRRTSSAVSRGGVGNPSGGSIGVVGRIHAHGNVIVQVDGQHWRHGTKGRQVTVRSVSTVAMAALAVV